METCERYIEHKNITLLLSSLRIKLPYHGLYKKIDTEGVNFKKLAKDMFVEVKLILGKSAHSVTFQLSLYCKGVSCGSLMSS